MDDSVRTLRNNFYLGHFSKVIDEVKEFGDETPPQMAFYFRAFLQTEPEEVFNNVNDRSSTVSIQPLIMLHLQPYYLIIYLLIYSCVSLGLASYQTLGHLQNC